MIKIILILFLSISCIKNIKKDDTDIKSEATISLKDIIVDDDFNFETTELIKVSVFSSEMVQVTLYEIDPMKKNTKEVGVFTLDRELNIVHKNGKKSKQLLLVAKENSKTSYHYASIKNGTAIFDLRI